MSESRDRRPTPELTAEDLQPDKDLAAPLDLLPFNVVGLELQVDDDVVRLMVPPSISRSLAVVSLLVVTIGIAFWLLCEWWLGEAFTLGQRSLVLTVVVGTPIALVLLSIWSHRRRLRTSPVLEIDQAHDKVSILAGQQTFATAEVVCLLAVGYWTSSEQSSSWSELRLMIEREGRREQFYLCPGAANLAWSSFGNVLRPLAEIVDIPVLVAEGQGRFADGVCRVQRL